MKGFPNQISDLKKLAAAVRVIRELVSRGENPRDDGTFGEALVRNRVIGTGHTPKPIEEYLREQKLKTLSNQSFRTTARGLRELFVILGLIRDDNGVLALTSRGEVVSNFAGRDLDDDVIAAWRRIIRDMEHEGGDEESSHPYQVLLRLVARRPGISRAYCALALEAKDDSETELKRILKLSKLSEEEILEKLGVTPTNWDNAKKILPSFAEQLGDVVKDGHSFFLSDSPGTHTSSQEDHPKSPKKRTRIRVPRSSSSVTSKSIAQAGTVESFDEKDDTDEPTISAEKLKARKKKLRSRLKRHNLIVQSVAEKLEDSGAELFEMPFDCLACFEEHGILVEVKSLDGSYEDEVARVRDALSQLLYYESFVTSPLTKDRSVIKAACFESKISDDHIQWLLSNNILVIWKQEEEFTGEQSSVDVLRHFMPIIS